MTSTMPDKIQTKMKKRFLKYGTKNIDFSITLKSVYLKYDGKCQNCGVTTKHLHPPQDLSASVEHIVPLRSGGSHTWDNVELLCYKCNSARNTALQKDNQPISVAKFKIFGYAINITKVN